jgi:hypothetical protein
LTTILKIPDYDASGQARTEQMSFFLALPAEIQDIILRFAVTEPHAITIDSLIVPSGSGSPAQLPQRQLKEERYHRRRLNDFYSAAQPPITRVCRTIRLRALPLFYRHNTFLLVIRHTEVAHQQYRACYPTSPSTKKADISAALERLHCPPRQALLPNNLPTRFIRHLETSHVLWQNLQRFRIRHIFRRVDFEVEFETCKTALISAASPQLDSLEQLDFDHTGLHRQRHPGYRIVRVIPSSADGWVYGYVRRAKMWLLFYDDHSALGVDSRGLWRRLIDVKGLVQYGWSESKEHEDAVQKKLALRS